MRNGYDAIKKLNRFQRVLFLLASLMRRMNICEERVSGIDRAIEAIEVFQLPAPKFIRGEDYTRIIIYAPIPINPDEC